MRKTIKVKLPSNKLHDCPICGRTNNYLYGNVCEHVDRVTVKSIIIYRVPIYKTMRIGGTVQKVNINKI